MPGGSQWKSTTVDKISQNQRNDISQFIHSIESNCLILYYVIDFVFRFYWFVVMLLIIPLSVKDTWQYPVSFDIIIFTREVTIVSPNICLWSSWACYSYSIVLRQSTWNVFKVGSKICSELIKTQKRCYWHRSGVFYVNYDHFEHVNSGWEFVSFEWSSRCHDVKIGGCVFDEKSSLKMLGLTLGYTGLGFLHCLYF